MISFCCISGTDIDPDAWRAIRSENGAPITAMFDTDDITDVAPGPGAAAQGVRPHFNPVQLGSLSAYRRTRYHANNMKIFSTRMRMLSDIP